MSAETDAILDEAYRILSEEKGWCQGASAKTAAGDPLLSGDAPGAVSVCLDGALSTATLRLHQHIGREYDAAYGRVQRAAGNPGFIHLFNDDPHTTKEDVLLVLKRARYDFGDES